MKLQGNENLETRTIKNFVDILILKYLKIHPSVSGYQVLRHLHDTFNISFSPGTIYHEIYLLERKNLIKSEGDDNSRNYCLTDKGKEALVATYRSSAEIQELVSAILSDD